MVLQRSETTFPETTTIELVALEDLQFPVVSLGLDYWNAQRGKRRFPAREDIRARDIISALPNMVLVKVLDGGNDFLLKIVGDEVGRSYRAPLNNRKMSEIAAELPNTVERWGALYRQVAQTGVPIAVRVVVGLDTPEINFTQAETICLPLGPTDDCVDHLITFGKRTSRTTTFHN